MSGLLPDPERIRQNAQTPSQGRIVIFRSRTGDYSCPAIVTATQRDLNPKGVKAYEASGGSAGVPDLSSPDHVHLTVFTPGIPGLREGAEDFKVESAHARSENVAGSYQEWDVPFDPLPPAEKIQPGERAEQRPGSWRWPERV